jgi:F0F1-type ATP synthase epsilon subunit
MTDIPILTITIKKPGEIIFSGTAHAVTSVSNRGTFDILAYHANFITLINEKVIIHQNNQSQVIPITAGIMKVRKNIIKIILGIETHENGMT